MKKKALEACPDDFTWPNWIEKSKNEMLEIACLNFFHRMKKLQYNISFLTQPSLEEIRNNGLKVKDDSAAEDAEDGDEQGEAETESLRSQDKRSSDTWRSTDSSWSQGKWHRNSYSRDRWHRHWNS